MLASGVQQLFDVGGFRAIMESLGYPDYFSKIIGGWKILGVLAILIPGRALLKEWTYAGFFFVTSGAIVSHLFTHNSIIEIIGPLLLLVMTVLSWYFRGAARLVKVQ